jgi:hypothetical protein
VRVNTSGNGATCSYAGNLPSDEDQSRRDTGPVRRPGEGQAGTSKFRDAIVLPRAPGAHRLSLISSLIHLRTPASIGVYRRSLSSETDLCGRSCTVILNTEKRKVGSSILPLITTHPVVLAVLTSANAYSAPSCRYQLSDHGCPCVTGVCRPLSHADRTPPRCRALPWLFLPVRLAAVWGDSTLPMAAPQKG